MAYKKTVGIYKITSPSGKTYIGKSKNINQRRNNYKSSLEKVKSQIRLYNSINKYGWENHVFEIIEECEIIDLYCKERYWQDFYNVIGENGLNCILTSCEEHPSKSSEETCKKKSEATKGKNNPMYGKDWRQGKTQEQLDQHKLNVSEAQIQYFTYEKGAWENVTIFKANTTAKKVKNKRTGDTFISLKQASQYYNLPYSTLHQRMIGERHKRNELQYI